MLGRAYVLSQTLHLLIRLSKAWLLDCWACVCCDCPPFGPKLVPLPTPVLILLATLFPLIETDNDELLVVDEAEDEDFSEEVDEAEEFPMLALLLETEDPLPLLPVIVFAELLAPPKLFS